MILLTGATGFVGNAVLTQLMQQPDMAVRTYGRREPVWVNTDRVDDARAQVFNHVTGEISAAADYASALAAVDVVIHCAAQAHVMKHAANNAVDIYRDINVDGTLHLAQQAITAGVKRFIFISSIKVNGESTIYSQPFMHDDVAAPEDAYGRSKQAAEDGLRQLVARSGMDLVIIRPPLVYGPGVKGNFSSLLTIAKKNFPLPFGSINNQRSMVALANLVHLIITCIRHPHAANQTFLVSDDEDISTTKLLEMMTRAAGKPPRLLPVPMSWLRFLGRMTGKQAVIDRLCGNLQVDISHTKNTLGWQPPISVAEGIKRCFIEEE